MDKKMRVFQHKKWMLLIINLIWAQEEKDREIGKKEHRLNVWLHENMKYSLVHQRLPLLNLHVCLMGTLLFSARCHHSNQEAKRQPASQSTRIQKMNKMCKYKVVREYKMNEWAGERASEWAEYFSIREWIWCDCGDDNL